MEDRIKTAVLTAEAAFWASIAASYPEAKTGDLDPSQAARLETEMAYAVESWVKFNAPITTKPYEEREPEDWAVEMNLTYADTWHMHDTGGHCMVVASDNVVVAGEHRYLAISSDCVCIYTDKFDEESWLQDHLCCWSFGDNPTVLMNYIDEFFGGHVLWDTGKLFHDIMQIQILKLNVW